LASMVELYCIHITDLVSEEHYQGGYDDTKMKDFFVICIPTLSLQA